MQLMSVHTSVGDTGINCIRAFVWKRRAEHVGSFDVVSGLPCVCMGGTPGLLQKECSRPSTAPPLCSVSARGAQAQGATRTERKEAELGT